MKEERHSLGFRSDLRMGLSGVTVILIRELILGDYTH